MVITAPQDRLPGCAPWYWFNKEAGARKGCRGMLTLGLKQFKLCQNRIRNKKTL